MNDYADIILKLNSFIKHYHEAVLKNKYQKCVFNCLFYYRNSTRIRRLDKQAKCPLSVRKKSLEKLLSWDAHYAGIKAMRERQQNSITLDELVKEVMPLLFPYVPFIIEDQIPVFTAWAENNSKSCIRSQKKNYSNKHKSY